MSQTQVDRLLTRLNDQDGFADALVEKERYDWMIPNLTNHPKDRHVLAVAVATGAQIIVTFNVKDFPAEALKPHNREVKNPDDFLMDQFFLDRDLIIQLISRESQVLKNPPQTVQQILDRLRKHTPKFVAEIENYLAQTERRFLKP
jgi:hypothetical protein